MSKFVKGTDADLNTRLGAIEDFLAALPDASASGVNDPTKVNYVMDKFFAHEQPEPPKS